MTPMVLPRPAALFALLSLGLLAACAQPTSYVQAGPGSAFGYADDRIDSTTWQVSFSGNRTTPREQVERLLLYRAAKLAEEKQAPHFLVIDKEIERETRFYGTVFPQYVGFGAHYHRIYRHRFPHRLRFPGFGSTAGFLRPSHRYTGHATVRLFDAPPPEGAGVAYETADVLKTLAPAVGVPQDAN